MEKALLTLFFCAFSAVEKEYKEERKPAIWWAFSLKLLKYASPGF
jgi:hypothetical protein